MVTIRLATLADIPSIMELIAGVVPIMNAAGNFQWDTTYPNAQVFTNDVVQEQLWVAEMDGVITGVAAITTDQDPEYADVGWNITEFAIVTHRLAVSIAHQGAGIAKALLNKAETVAIERGIEVLRIDTNSENKATQKLFPALGYTYAGEITLNFRQGLRFFCYEKRLKP
ncbi:N-acetyltransferase family protein [Mucilaginibacter sp.]